MKNKSVNGIQHGLQPIEPRLGSSSSTRMLQIIYKNEANYKNVSTKRDHHTDLTDGLEKDKNIKKYAFE